MKQRLFILNEPTAPRLNPALACEIGLNESLILLQLEFWISISDNVRDGQQWTYQSTRDIREKAFPFWSVMTINRTIKSLENLSLINTTSKYNAAKYDKTRWFSMNYEGISKLKSISIKGYGTGSSQNGTGSNQDGTTIPENTTEIKNDVLKTMVQPPPMIAPKSTPPPLSIPNSKKGTHPPTVDTQSTKSAIEQPVVNHNNLELAIAALVLLVPEDMRKPSVVAKIAGAVESGIATATIRGCIAYSNDHSDQKTWQRYRSHLGRCIDEKWGQGYQRDNGEDQEAKDKAALQGRRGLPDHVLKVQSDQGDKYAKQILQERGIKY